MSHIYTVAHWKPTGNKDYFLWNDIAPHRPEDSEQEKWNDLLLEKYANNLTELMYTDLLIPCGANPNERFLLVPALVKRSHVPPLADASLGTNAIPLRRGDFVIFWVRPGMSLPPHPKNTVTAYSVRIGHKVKVEMEDLVYLNEYMYGYEWND